MGFMDKLNEMVAEAKEEAARAKDDAKELSKQRVLSRYHGFVLREASIEKVKGDDKGHFPLSELTGASVETGEELEKRYTATRILALGVFALAFKKKTKGTFFLAIEGESFTWLEEIPYKEKAKAMKFANEVRAAAKKAS